MRLYELFEPMASGFYEPSADVITKADSSDLEKERLTLRKLNKLKKLRSFRQYNYSKRLDVISQMYSPASDDSGGM